MGLLVSGSKDNLIKFWDSRTGTGLTTLYVSRALSSVLGTRVDIMHPAINIRITYKPSHGLLMEICSRAHRATKLCESSIFAL